MFFSRSNFSPFLFDALLLLLLLQLHEIVDLAYSLSGQRVDSILFSRRQNIFAARTKSRAIKIFAASKIIARALHQRRAPLQAHRSSVGRVNEESSGARRLFACRPGDAIFSCGRPLVALVVVVVAVAVRRRTNKASLCVWRARAREQRRSDSAWRAIGTSASAPACKWALEAAGPATCVGPHFSHYFNCSREQDEERGREKTRSEQNNVRLFVFAFLQASKKSASQITNKRTNERIIYNSPANLICNWTTLIIIVGGRPRRWKHRGRGRGGGQRKRRRPLVGRARFVCAAIIIIGRAKRAT